MNKFKLVQIICWSIVFIVFISLAIWFASKIASGDTRSSGFSTYNLSGPYEEVGRYQLENTDISGIDINWISGSVLVTPYEGNDITLIEYAQRALEPDEVMEYKVSDEKLKVKFRSKNNKIFDNMPSKKLELFIPYILAEDINEIDIDTVSARVDISDITSDDFEVSTVSGFCETNNINSNKINISTTSGGITIMNSKSDSIETNTVSGKIKLNSVFTDKLSFDTTSGDVNISDCISSEVSHSSVSGTFDFEGELKILNANSTSGRVILANRIAADELDIDTVSGKINVSIPKSDNIRIKYSTISGKISCDFPILINESDSNYYFSTGSGDISIKELIN